MTELLIAGARLLDPHHGVDRQANLFIARGGIVSIGRKPRGFVAREVLDADGLTVIPGLVDLRATLGNDALAEQRAAAAGGMVALHVCLPGGSLSSGATAGPVRLHALGDLLGNLPDEPRLSAVGNLRGAGVAALNVGPWPVQRESLRRAMAYAAGFGMPVMVSPALGPGFVHAGSIALRLGLAGQAPEHEAAAVHEVLALAAPLAAQLRLHLGPLSTGEAVAAVAAARDAGLEVTADVAAHQLCFTDAAVIDFDTGAYTQPPLRGEAQRQALLAGVRAGTLRVSSDHRPSSLDRKRTTFTDSEPGMATLQTVLPLLLGLVAAGDLTLAQAIAAVTGPPLDGAPGAGQAGGAAGLQTGAAADLCLFDPDECWRVDLGSWHSAGRNTLVWGQELTGRVRYTLVGGRPTYRRDGGAERFARVR